jgi:hypothetical protein
MDSAIKSLGLIRDGSIALLRGLLGSPILLIEH